MDTVTPGEAVLQLFELGVAMQRQNLRRRHPDATEAELDALLQRWLEHPAGAEHGDAVGRPVSWPRGDR